MFSLDMCDCLRMAEDCTFLAFLEKKTAPYYNIRTITFDKKLLY